MEPQITLQDAANQVYSMAAQRDEEIEKLMNAIQTSFSDLDNPSFTTNAKYQLVLESEHIFVKLRTMVEFEYIKLKRLLNDPSTPPVLRTFFTKRSVYLSEVSAKLTVIRDDLTLYSRIIYNSQFQFKH